MSHSNTGDADHPERDFVANLRLATSCHPSTTEVCRRLGINRQQFMKYLAGTSFPSRHNLRRICDFFGVDEFELLMPHAQFRGLVRLRPGQDSDAPAVPWRLRGLLQQAQRQRAELSRLLGWYYMHYHSASCPGMVLRALLSLHTWRDYTCYKRIERLSLQGDTRRPDIYKYAGVVLMVGDRLHLLDQETVTGNELSHTILYPSYRNRVLLLTGMTMGVSGADTHQPCASPVVLEALGRSVHARRALRGCGLFQPDAAELSAQVRQYLLRVNDATRPWQLRAPPA